jgi:hypothetical protein
MLIRIARPGERSEEVEREAEERGEWLDSMGCWESGGRPGEDGDGRGAVHGEYAARRGDGSDSGVAAGSRAASLTLALAGRPHRLRSARRAADSASSRRFSNGRRTLAGGQ